MAGDPYTILCVTLMPKLIISLLQEAEQADKAHTVENGTHAEETNAEGNLDDSIVMPSLLSCFPLMLRFFPLCLTFSFPSSLTRTIPLLSTPVDLITLSQSSH